MGAKSLRLRPIKFAKSLTLVYNSGSNNALGKKMKNEDLFGAAYFGHPKGVKEVLDAGINVNAKDERTSRTALHFLAGAPYYHSSSDKKTRFTNYHNTDHFTKTAELLRLRGADVTAVDNDGMTALHYAAGLVGSDKVVEELLKFDCINVNATDKKGRTPLQIALYTAGQQKIVDQLLAKDPAITPPNDGTALHFYSALPEDKAGAKLTEALAQEGVDVNTRDDEGRTALHYAVMHNLPHAVKALIEKGANVNSVDSKGNSVLHLVRFANKDIAEALLKAGADVTAVDKNNETPLHHAARMGEINKEVVNALIAAKADVYAKRTDGETPLINLLDKLTLDEVKKFITKENINEVLWKGSSKTTYLYQAPSSGSLEVVEYLLSMGADINGLEGCRPLIAALKNPNPKVLERLLEEQGLDAKTKDEALREAANLNNDSKIVNDPVIGEKVKALIDAKADLTATNSYDQTPLHIAAIIGTGRTMQQLIKAGANVKAVDKEGKTPLHHLLKRGTGAGLVTIFLEAGADLYAADNDGKTPFDYYKGDDADLKNLLNSKRTWGADIKHFVKNPISSNNWFLPTLVGTGCIALVLGYCALVYHVIKNAQVSIQVSCSPKIVNDMINAASKGAIAK